MNILVTGGSGYIGMVLARSLIQHGHTVRVFDLLPPAPKQRQEGFEYVPGDLLNPESLASALEDMKAVYHLAWSFYPEDHRCEEEENPLGTLNLLEARKVARVKHFIFASNATVYGPTGEKPVHESDPCHLERSTIGDPSRQSQNWHANIPSWHPNMTVPLPLSYAFMASLVKIDWRNSQR